MAEYTRLLLCKDCGTLEELPDYEGDPSRDFLLETLVQKHPNHTAHPLMKVESKHWNVASTRATIIEQIRERTGHTGFDTTFYTAKATFQEDALQCFQRHNRNPACSDYKSSSKMLTPNTAAERKAAGLPKYRSAQDKYLCEFCPVHSLVQQAARKTAGLYK